MVLLRDSSRGSLFEQRFIEKVGEGNKIHCSIFAWRVPWTEEPGGLQSSGCKESDTVAKQQNFTEKVAFEGKLVGAEDSRPVQRY